MTRWRSAPAQALALVVLLAGACTGTNGDTAPTTMTPTAPPVTAQPTPTETTVPGPPPTPVELPDGTLVWALGQEPVDLHVDDPETTTEAAAWIRQGLWEGLFGVSIDEQLVPELLNSEPEVHLLDDGSMRVDFVLRPGLNWSDGTTLTASDVKHTLEVILARDEDGEPVFRLADRVAYDGIVGHEATSDTEFSITWGAPYGGWRSVLPVVHPAHVFSTDPLEAAEEANAALPTWSHEGVILPSSGPLVFESWSRGTNMRLVRNEQYHGVTHSGAPWGGLAGAEAVLVRFVNNEAAVAHALLDGAADLGVLRSSGLLPPEGTLDTLPILASSSHVLLFDTSSVHLADPAVRRAVALAINRQALADLTPGRRGGEQSGIVTGSALWLLQQQGYEDRLAEFGLGDGDVVSARLQLFDADYGFLSTGTAVHLERGAVVLRLRVESGRMGVAAISALVDQLRSTGVEVEVVEADAAADLVVQEVSGSAWPGDRANRLHLPTEENGPEEVPEPECGWIVDAAAGAACYAELDRWLIGGGGPGGTVVVPLWQDTLWYVTSPDGVERFVPSSMSRRAGLLTSISELVPAGRSGG